MMAENNQKPFYKQWWFVALAAVLVSGLISDAVTPLGYVLAVLGLLGAVGCAVWLVIRAVRKQPVQLQSLCAILCLSVCLGAAAMVPGIRAALDTDAEPVAETAEPAKAEEPAVDSMPVAATNESLEALFMDGQKLQAEDVSVCYTPDTGYVSVSCTSRKTAWDETSFLRDCLSCYVNYCRAAYELDGVNDVYLCIFTEMTDSRGNKNDEAVFKMEMERDVFQQYNWDNMEYKSGVYEQIEADCKTLDIHAGIRSRADLDKVYYVP